MTPERLAEIGRRRLQKEGESHTHLDPDIQELLTEIDSLREKLKAVESELVILRHEHARSIGLNAEIRSGLKIAIEALEEQMEIDDHCGICRKALSKIRCVEAGG